jgi:uncharacterized protein YndB with AHSA1/START domain
MSGTITLAPVKRTLHLRVPPARAFEVFTAGMSRWWPVTHTTLQTAFKDAVVEPHAGGRWYHTGSDGSTAEVGRVRVWEPPSRLLLVWQLDPKWQYDANLDTEVEVNFIAEGDGTIVEFEHRHIERMGEGAEAAHAAVGSPGGWTGLLEEYRKYAEGV